MYQVIFAPPAANFIKKIKDRALKEGFRRKIDEIRENPAIGKAKLGDLAGVYCCDLFYNKTNYEIAYTLVEKQETIIVVILAGTRENFYQELKRYMSS